MTILGADSTIHGVTGAENCINSLIRKSRAAFYADDYVKHTTHTTMKVNKKDTNIIENLSEVFERVYFFLASVRPSRTHRQIRYRDIASASALGADAESVVEG